MTTYQDPFCIAYPPGEVVDIAVGFYNLGSEFDTKPSRKY
jgi:hypothetical protein